jgi:hypothetical protein
VFDIGFRVRWSKQNPLQNCDGAKYTPFFKHSVKIAFEALAVTFHGVRKIVHRLGSEVCAKHRSATVECYGDSCGFSSLPQACFKRLPQVFQQCVGVASREFLQSRNACRHREGISAAAFLLGTLGQAAPGNP